MAGRQAPVVERMEEEALLKRSASSQSQTIVKISAITPHLLESTSITTKHTNTLSTGPSRTPSLGSGSTASSSAAPTVSGSTAGSVLGIVFIVVLVLSVISCAAGCIWRCCIQKGRKERATQANQQRAQEYPQRFPQGRSQHYGHESNIPKEPTYRRTQNEISMQDIDMESTLRSGKPNAPRRFETIPELEDMQEEYPVEHEPANSSNLQNSNISPRKGYFYHQDKAGREHS